MVRWRGGGGVILIISLYYDFYSYCMQQAPIYKQCVWLSYMCCRLYVRGRPISTYIYFCLMYIYIYIYKYICFFVLCSVRSDCVPMVLSPWSKGGCPQPVATGARGSREHLIATGVVGGSVKGCKNTPKTKPNKKRKKITEPKYPC